MRRVIGRMITHSRAAVALGTPLLLGLSLTACDTLNKASDSVFGGGVQPGQQGYVSGFLGGTVADEPRAALLGREVLSAGGSAGDAVAAMGLGLSVTLPSRAGLGGGGACIAYAPGSDSQNKGVPESVLFVPLAPRTGSAGDRPAALPLMARGLFALHARYGFLPFEALLAQAENLARGGVPASRTLVRDLNAVSGPLFADPTARDLFGRGGKTLTEGQRLVQPALAGTLAQLRLAGVGDLYQGAMARRLATESAQAGGTLTVEVLRGALPGFLPALTVAYGNDRVAFPAPPADGGLAAAAAFSALVRDPSDLAGASARSLAAAARWRAGGGDPAALIAATDLPAAGMPSLPASTTFGAVDRKGNAVMCATTMGNLFGTGRMLPGLGFLLAASPASLPPPLLSVGLAWNPRENAFHAAAGGSGQAGAPVAVAAGLMNALRTGKPMAAPVPEPGRANVMSCAGLLPGKESTCALATDPRESGLAMSGG